MNAPKVPSRLLLTLTALVVSTVFSQATLVWHSAMDGDAAGIVGPDGIAVGAPTAIEDLNGNPNGAVKFDGANDYYELGVIAASLNAGTMSFWARTDAHGNDKGPVAMGISGGGASEYFVIQDRANGRWRADVDNGAARLDAFDNNPPLITGTWHHVASTFAAGGDLKIYIDGVLQTDVQALTAAHDLENLGPWQIGAERVGGRYYDGALDDVRLWDEELDAAAITALFNGGPLFAANPTDSDNDGMSDAFEQKIIDADAGDAIEDLDDVLPGDDFDNDGANNGLEDDNNTDPTDEDTDDDGLLDGVETNDGTFNDLATDTGTDPRDADTDDDTLSDGVETNDGTFNDIDTDTGTNPLLEDTDTDMMPDGYELDNMLDPLVDDGGLDPDSDMSTNFNEFDVGTDPQNPDTDGDGYKDGVETDDDTFDDIATDTGTDPLDPDTDGDGLVDGVETNDGTFNDAMSDTGTHPLVVDTDMDGFTDGAEVNTHGTNPNDDQSVPGVALRVLFIGGNATGDQTASQSAARHRPLTVTATPTPLSSLTARTTTSILDPSPQLSLPVRWLFGLALMCMETIGGQSLWGFPVAVPPSIS